MKRKNIFIIIGILVLAGVIVALTNPGLIMDMGMKMTSNMKHRDAAAESAAFTIKADAFSNEFKTNKDANAKYLDKSVLVEGAITDIQLPVISLGNVACTLDSAHLNKANTLKVGDNVKIQGQFVGYNELMDELDLSKCGIK